MAICPKCHKALLSLEVEDNEIERSPEYSFKKGLAGAALFGPVGAVAGINGKRKITTEHKQWMVCHECGYRKYLGKYTDA